ncbi:TrbM/KikA/MpfK family conjugal transfer protein [Noviherbaspirillum sp.]|uniref:TrbM/KikA/MpfK family conjugal transfer protein n=1 Tax=Noviherbaspirillum sp. TaxID=1926288 RepID=UPI002FDF4425
MRRLLSLSVGGLLSLPSIPAAHAQEILTGDTRLACEAVLCLASSQRPDECTPSVRRFFSIQHRRVADTIRGRSNFLRLCPASDSDENMRRLVESIAAGAGRCSAQALNHTLTAPSARPSEGNGHLSNVGNVMPAYCTAYLTNPYTDLQATRPVYVGTPERGGLWVEPEEYAQAQAAYNARVAAEDDSNTANRTDNNSSGF